MANVKVLNERAFEKVKFDFLSKHGGYTVVHESAKVKRGGGQGNNYECVDGAAWFESAHPITITQDVQTEHGKVEIDLTLLQVEAWTSDGKYTIMCYKQI